MIGKDELNSTERLLNSIRNSNQEQQEPVAQLPPEKKPPALSKVIQKSSFSGTRTKRKTTTGVFIDSGYVSMAQASGKPVSGKNLIQWAHVPVPEDLTLENERFPVFLRSALSGFLGKAGKKTSIWTALSSKNCKFRVVTIPELPPAKQANAVFWSMKKEMEIDAEKEVFDFHPMETFSEAGSKKIRVHAYTGLKEEIDCLKKTFSKAGYPLSGITSTPFSLQNLIRTHTVDAGSGTPFSIVNIAKEYTEISCFSGANLLMVRTIKTGANSLSDENDDSSLERLAGKIARTGDYFSQQYAGNQPIVQNLFFGETDDSENFMDYAAGFIDSRLTRLEPFSSHLGQPGIMRLPAKAGERAGVIPAFGLALSSNEVTPNLLFTFVEKNRKKKYRKMNSGIFALFMLGMIACISYWVWQDRILNTVVAEKQSIERELDNYRPNVTQETITSMIASARAKQKKNEAYAQTIAPLGVINEICSLTPDSIRLFTLESSYSRQLDEAVPQNRTGPGRDTKNEKKAQRVLTIEGRVQGEPNTLESGLTQYILMLSDSPLFGDISLKNKEIVNVETGEVGILKFTASMEIL